MLKVFIRIIIPAVFGVYITLSLGACANVAFTHGTSDLKNKSLLFGSIVLERSGEQVILSGYSTPIVIRNIASADEPGLITQRFDNDGSFYWAMPPGQYQLTIVLSPFSDGIKSYGFSLGKPGTAYYFGDLILSGKKHFHSLGGANIDDVTAHFEDNFDRAKNKLLKKNPQLKAAPVRRLLLKNMDKPENRWALYSEALNAGKLCCSSLSTLPYAPLSVSQSRTYDIGAHTGIFDFPSGKSRFLAWKLPNSTDPYVIDIRSIVTPSNLPGTGRFYIFSPAVMLLDDKFNVISDKKTGLFVPVPASIMPPRSASIRARIKISDSRAKYLILYTTRSIIEKKLSTWMPGFIAVPGGAIPSGLSKPVHMEPAISGEIEISISPLRK